MKQLSIKFFTIALALCSISLYSCKKEAGPQGIQGEPGVDGNANVTQISFGSKTINTLSSISLTLPGITKSVAEKSMILAYGRSAGNVFWYQLPGFGYLGSREYRTFVEARDPSSILTIAMISGTSSETFDAIRVLVIPANILTTGFAAPPYDISDYESMRAYFNLPK